MRRLLVVATLVFLCSENAASAGDEPAKAEEFVPPSKSSRVLGYRRGLRATEPPARITFLTPYDSPLAKKLLRKGKLPSIRFEDWGKGSGEYEISVINSIEGIKPKAGFYFEHSLVFRSEPLASSACYHPIGIWPGARATKIVLKGTCTATVTPGGEKKDPKGIKMAVCETEVVFPLNGREQFLTPFDSPLSIALREKRKLDPIIVRGNRHVFRLTFSNVKKIEGTRPEAGTHYLDSLTLQLNPLVEASGYFPFSVHMGAKITDVVEIGTFTAVFHARSRTNMEGKDFKYTVCEANIAPLTQN